LAPVDDGRGELMKEKRKESFKEEECSFFMLKVLFYYQYLYMYMQIYERPMCGDNVQCEMHIDLSYIAYSRNQTLVHT
jgi:hypothetical protein